MPISRKESAVQVSTGDITVTTTPATAGVQVVDHQQVAPGTTNVPSGAYQVIVYNTGFEPITVNGDTLLSNDKAVFEARENPTNNRMDFTPAIAIVVPAEGSAFYTENRPSA